jgi:hypothetical protein
VSRDGARLSASMLTLGGNDDVMQNMTAQLVDVASKNVLGPSTQPTGFQAFAPNHASYLASDGMGSGTTNQFFLIDGNAGTSTSIAVGAANSRPTQPDWSPDGSKIVFVIPTQAGYVEAGAVTRGDDTHIFGGSLWRADIGNGSISNATALLTSTGENNYYPAWSPDGAWIAFNQARLTGTVGTISNCTNILVNVQGSCPNDSFFNPGSMLMIMPAAGGAPVMLETSGVDAHSYPRWAPSLTSYKGQPIAWITFASTQDYGLRVRNHISGANQAYCYPPDSAENPGGSHQAPWPNNCEEPQIWMEAVNLEAAAAGRQTPSYPAIWVPYQDSTKHDIMAQWATTYVP